MSGSARRSVASVVGLLLLAAVWWWVTVPTDGDALWGAEEASAPWQPAWIIDGDTFDAAHGDTQERVRIIGIDTPEREQCGYAEARAALAEALDGRSVILVPGANTDRDPYGRLLRYVEVEGEDIGLQLIERGLARARYDSRSGQPHDRERVYWAADEASPDMCP